jgi:hypothetical protein
MTLALMPKVWLAKCVLINDQTVGERPWNLYMKGKDSLLIHVAKSHIRLVSANSRESAICTW